jgi:hypothetical protein
LENFARTKDIWANPGIAPGVGEKKIFLLAILQF